MAKNIDEFLSDAEHEAVDHTAAPFSLLDGAAHDLRDHTGLPGVSSGPSVQVTNNGGATQGPQPTLNVIPSGSIGVSVVDDPGNSRVNLTISAPTPGITHLGTFQSGTTGTNWGSMMVTDTAINDYLVVIHVFPSNLTGSTTLIMRFAGQTTGYTNSNGGATTYVNLGTIAAGAGSVIRVKLRSVFYFTDISMSAGNYVKTADVRRLDTNNTEFLNRAIGTALPAGGLGTIDLLTTSSLEASVRWDLYQYAGV